MAFASINQTSVGGGSSNALSIQSDGIFMPRLSTAQRTALALTTSDTGLTVYDFTLNNLFIWNGTAWESIPGSGDAGANGSVQYNDNGTVSGATNFVWDKVNGRVGIGTATPAVALDVVGAINTTSNVVAKGGSALIVNRADNLTSTQLSDSGSGGFLINNLNSSGINLQFAGVTALTLNPTANLVLKGGTAGANGVGVTFPAVQVASSDANCLDDYEEGTWVGTLTGSTTNPTVPVTATGRYTKIGRVVTVQITYTGVNTTGASGGIAITGLPFANTSAAQSVGTVSLYQIGTFTGSTFAIIDSSSSSIELNSNISGSVYGVVTHNAGTNRYMTISVTYTV